MKPDDKRKTTSRLNALKSTGPKTPEGKQASALNACTHGAYAAQIVLPGESIDDYEAMVETHFAQFKPDNLIARSLVSQMATTLWRLNRIAPAEAYMIRIQLDRMEPVVRIQYGEEGLPAAALYALGLISLEGQGSAHTQLLSQERRLLTQYTRLRQVLLTLPEQPPPASPIYPDFQDGKVHSIYTEDYLKETEEAVEEPPTIPNETKLTPPDQAPTPPAPTPNETKLKTPLNLIVGNLIILSILFCTRIKTGLVKWSNCRSVDLAPPCQALLTYRTLITAALLPCPSMVTTIGTLPLPATLAGICTFT